MRLAQREINILGRLEEKGYKSVGGINGSDKAQGLSYNHLAYVFSNIQKDRIAESKPGFNVDFTIVRGEFRLDREPYTDEWYLEAIRQRSPLFFKMTEGRIKQVIRPKVGLKSNYSVVPDLVLAQQASVLETVVAAHNPSHYGTQSTLY